MGPSLYEYNINGIPLECSEPHKDFLFKVDRIAEVCTFATEILTLMNRSTSFKNLHAYKMPLFPLVRSAGSSSNFEIFHL